MTDEPNIPFDLRIIYEDERIIVVDKPHFLPTTPRGMWFRSTALMRLRERYDDPDIIPAHRLDRSTAGVVVFVRDPAARGADKMLFKRHETQKTYESIAPASVVRR
ncbi:MAG: pseudouridine synthase, partial [Bifidobacterium crudilactis]|nr:pseudouridine synthase [Bifidobacterium crudilactis]